MATELTLLVLRAAIFVSLAVVLVLLIRKPLRRCLGAALSYQAWLIVPFVTVAALAPGPSTSALQVAPVLRTVQAVAAQAAPLATARVDLLLFVWACGVLAFAGWFVIAHRTFLRKAGRLTRSRDVYVSEADAGPASVGLFHPRIIVPYDFAQRYSPVEQALVIAHEQTHISRRDAVANVSVAVFQCAFWFNPLVHVGALCFRQDQEIACDAIVMQRHPRQLRNYAEALLKFHTGVFSANPGINCHWQTHHPTKERLMSLQQIPFGPVRRLAGRCIVALLAAGATAGTLSARAEQSASAPLYSIVMTIDAGGKQSTPRVLAKAGEQFAVASGDWRLEMTVRQAKTPGDVWVAGKIFNGPDVVSAPTLLARLNGNATIKVGDGSKPFALSMVVSPQP